MGEHKVERVKNARQSQRFMVRLLQDLEALERIIYQDMIESDIQRCGVEQELCFVDQAFQPAPVAMEVLERSTNHRFTTELARFNAEINLDPMIFTGDCLSRMEQQLLTLLKELELLAVSANSKTILVGVLPTISMSDLTKENITPLKRYHALNNGLLELRGGPYELRLEGTDQLITTLDSSMFESCNTSFQIHYQLSAHDFVNQYNWAQAIAGPVLATATNAPLLLGKRLWRETRIALFQQSLDTRSVTNFNTEKVPRVSFGKQWLKESVLELFREDISRHRILLHTADQEEPLKMLDSGDIPKLKALSLHNGTIYRWNRACYGITQGKPHLRIENRYLPSGPSVIDEVANAAFWLGLMKGLPEKYGQISEFMDFDMAKSNFIKAARLGLGAQMLWPGKGRIQSGQLILDVLLPLAFQGLEKAGVSDVEANKYLQVIEDRVTSEKTGSQWQTDSFNKIKQEHNTAKALVAVTAGMIHRQQQNLPVHQWNTATITEAGRWENRLGKVGHIMSTDLFTVRPDDPIDFVIKMMDWRRIHHIPVEDGRRGLVGLVTATMLIPFATIHGKKDKPTLISDIMIKDPITIKSDANIDKALDAMVANRIGCLPVVEDKHLVGIVTETDLVKVAQELIKEIKKDDTTP
ncbi:MAG: CBS domain-containing protein [Cyclobacteriaceae bacterium]